MGILQILFSVVALVPLSAEEPADGGIAVVELFTSQGCSSCPPADRLLATLAEQDMPGVFLLSFHVTYWDYLGWRDPFGDEAYSTRQRRYARTLSERVYTPQMIVNGETVFVGSNQSKARTAIAAALASPAPAQLRLEAQPILSGNLAVTWSAQAELRGRSLVVALVESDLQSKVTRGENRGRTLAHVNVVRTLATADGSAAHGELIVAVPADLNPNKARLIGYLQDGASLKILGATASTLATK